MIRHRGTHPEATAPLLPGLSPSRGLEPPQVLDGAGEPALTRPGGSVVSVPPLPTPDSYRVSPAGHLSSPEDTPPAPNSGRFAPKSRRFVVDSRRPILYLVPFVTRRFTGRAGRLPAGATSLADPAPVFTPHADQ